MRGIPLLELVSPQRIVALELTARLVSYQSLITSLKSPYA